MEVSPQVQDIIELLSIYADGRLHDPDGLGGVLQHAQSRGTPDAVGELAFKGKYLTRLQLTMRRQTPESELYEKLEQEFSRTVHEFHAMVSDFFADAEEKQRGMVERHYLTVSHDALRHLMQLAEDLTWLKNWELEMTQDQGSTSGTGTSGTGGADPGNADPGSAGPGGAGPGDAGPGGANHESGPGGGSGREFDPDARKGGDDSRST